MCYDLFWIVVLKYLLGSKLGFSISTLQGMKDLDWADDKLSLYLCFWLLLHFHNNQDLKVLESISGTTGAGAVEGKRNYSWAISFYRLHLCMVLFCITSLCLTEAINWSSNFFTVVMVLSCAT